MKRILKSLVLCTFLTAISHAQVVDVTGGQTSVALDFAALQSASQLDSVECNLAKSSIPAICRTRWHFQ